MMKKIATLSAAVFMMLLPAYASAFQIKGVKIPERITQEATQQKLILNGAGVRDKFIFDIYVAALYLPGRSASAEQILADGAPRRVVMHFLYKKIKKEKMRSAWREGFENNLAPEAFSALKPEIDAFNAAFGETVEGDVVIIDFLSDKTTRIRINGTEKTQIMGAEFQQALLSLWLGESPVDGGLKKAMLGSD